MSNKETRKGFHIWKDDNFLYNITAKTTDSEFMRYIGWLQGEGYEIIECNNMWCYLPTEAKPPCYAKELKSLIEFNSDRYLYKDSIQFDISLYGYLLINLQNKEDNRKVHYISPFISYRGKEFLFVAKYETDLSYFSHTLFGLPFSKDPCYLEYEDPILKIKRRVCVTTTPFSDFIIKFNLDNNQSSFYISIKECFYFTSIATIYSGNEFIKDNHPTIIHFDFSSDKEYYIIGGILEKLGYNVEKIGLTGIGRYPIKVT